MHEVITRLFEAVLLGNAEGVKEGIQEALDAGLSPEVILNQGMIDAMREVGRRFEAGEYFVPEMLVSARAMQAGMADLKPYLQQSDIKPMGRVVIGTVKGDLHDIGKNLVALMLEGAGFEIIDLGVDVAAEDFVKSIREEHPDILGLSALLTTTMLSMKQAIEAVAEAALRDKVKIMVGGAPVTDAYALEIGADGYAPDASQAVALAKSLASK